MAGLPPFKLAWWRAADAADPAPSETNPLATEQYVADHAGGGAVDSVNGQTGAVVLDAADVGLGNVDNTADTAKPVSTAQQTALDGKVAKAGDTVTGDLTINGMTRGIYAPVNRKEVKLFYSAQSLRLLSAISASDTAMTFYVSSSSPLADQRYPKTFMMGTEYVICPTPPSITYNPVGSRYEFAFTNVLRGQLGGGAAAARAVNYTVKEVCAMNLLSGYIIGANATGDGYDPDIEFTSFFDSDPVNWRENKDPLKLFLPPSTDLGHWPAPDEETIVNLTIPANMDDTGTPVMIDHNIQIIDPWSAPYDYFGASGQQVIAEFAPASIPRYISCYFQPYVDGVPKGWTVLHSYGVLTAETP